MWAAPITAPIAGTHHRGAGRTDGQEQPAAAARWTPEGPVAPVGEATRATPGNSLGQVRRAPGAGVTVVAVSEQLPDAGVPTSDPGISGTQQPELASRQVHRSPRYGAFLLTGAVIGVIVAVISGAIGTGDGSLGAGRLIGYLAMVFGLLGALLGGAVAVVVEHFSRPPRR